MNQSGLPTLQPFKQELLWLLRNEDDVIIAISETPQSWKQELIWVQRNSEDVIVRVEEKLPEGVDFIPSMAGQTVGYQGKRGEHRWT